MGREGCAVANLGEDRNAYIVLMKELEGQWPFGNRMHIQKNNIKVDLKIWTSDKYRRNQEPWDRLSL